MEVSGEIGIFEGQRACAPLQRHLYGWRGWLLWAFVPAIFLASWLEDGVGDLLSLDPITRSVIPILVIIACALAFIRFWRGMPRAAWARRGVANTFGVRYGIEDSCLVIDGEFSQTRLNWAGVSEIIPGSGAWLFIGQGAAYFLPTRLFGDVEAERSFLAACLEHMSPKARELSAAATAFISEA